MIMTNFAILDLDEWKTEIRTNGGAVQDYTISYQNLKPSTTYYFRVIAYNEFGISEPCTNDETVRFTVISDSGEIEFLTKSFYILEGIKLWIKHFFCRGNIPRNNY